MKKRCILLLLFVIVLALNANGASFRATKMWSKEEAGTHSFFVSSTKISITEIRFETGGKIEDSRMVVENLENKPSSIPTLKNIFQYIAIGKFGIDESDIKNRRIIFRVDKDWVQNYSTKEGITSHIYTNTWEALDTAYLSEDTTYYYYEAFPDIFSYFAVAGEEVEKVVSVAESDEEKAAKEQNNSQNTAAKAVSNANQNFIIRFFSDNKSIFIYAGILIAVLIFLMFGYSIISPVLKGENIANIGEAKEFIEAELSEGVSKSEIEKELIGSGWSKNFVDDIVHSEHLPPYIDVKLKAYIRSMQTNKTADEITSELAKQGWPEEVIRDILNDITGA